MTDRDMRGAVWPNKRREKDTHPHWTGQATIDGVEYWVSAWKKSDDAKESAPSISFSFKLKEEKRKEPSAPEQEFFDSDIPF